MSIPVMGHPAGPGVMGEQVLTGNTSKTRFNTSQVVIDYKRDAIEYSKKMRRMLSAGKDLWPVSLESLSVKMGLWKQRDSLQTLIRNAGSGNTLRPNGRKTRDTITTLDTVSTAFSVFAKTFTTNRGAQPINLTKNKFGSKVHGYLFFGTDTALTDIRNDTGYQNSLNNAGNRGDTNPLFTGRLVDWQGLTWFEHLTVQTDSNDVIGSTCAPKAKLGVSVGVGTALVGGKLPILADATETANLYFQDFPGYDYQYVEGQTAAPDATEYYAWFINTDGSVGFIKYTGTDNNGNRLTDITAILSPDGAGVSTLGSIVVGNIDSTGDGWGTGVSAIGGTGPGTSADFVYTDEFVAGATIIPANANGVPIGHSFLFGANALARCYGESEGMMPIEEKRDFGFFEGHGFEGCWGQNVTINSDGSTHGYTLLEHAIEHPGAEVPSL